jgi:DNA end-binding protein Ku
VVPQPKESSDAFAVVRKALQQTKKAAVGEIAFGGREHLVAIAVAKDDSFKGLMAYTLRYGDELREGKDYMPADGKGDVDKKQLAMASELIRAYSAPLQLDEFKDDYEAALRELIEAKQKNLPLPVEEKQPRGAKVTDLMDALRRSVTEVKRPPARQKAVPAARRNKGPVLVKANARKNKAA